MLNKFFASAFLVFLGLTNSQSAMALDIPVLTWERGVEHNIVLGGNTGIKNWKIELDSEKQAPLTFRQSKQNANGYSVYSVTIPMSYEPGVYTVATSGEGSPKKIVAGVKIVELSAYNLIKIPMKLIIILLTLIFFITTLSIMRMQKYERIQYLRPRPAASLPNIFATFYRMRGESVDSLNKSLFKFLLIREGELLHKASPIAWALAPAFSFLLGCLVGANGNSVSGVTHLSFAIFVLAAIVGIADPYSGFTATIGFAFVQTITGNVTSIRAVMVLCAVGVGWVAPGIISSLYQDMLRKDYYFSFAKRVVPDLIASGIGGLVFLISQILINSFSSHIGPITENGFLIPFEMSCVILLRMNLERFRLRNLHLTGENYQIRVLTLPRVVSPRTVAIASLYFAGTIYVWTQSLTFSLVVGLLLAAPLSLLVVRFDSPRLTLLSKYQRNILLEALVICIVAYIIFRQISNMPFDINQKGRLFIVDTALILFVHAFFSAIADTSSRQKVEQ